MTIYIPKGAPRGGAKSAWALPGFDQERFDNSEAGRNLAEMKKIYTMYPDEEMNPAVIKYWEDHGLKKELFDADVDDGKGKYSIFTPLDMDSAKRYALVYNSHGGMSPINLTETTGFSMLAGAEKFICVNPWNRGPSNDQVQSEFPRVLNEIVKKGYPVDLGRVYAVGYSSGSDATGVLTCAWPEMIAAVSPNPGGNLFAKGKWYCNPEFYKKNLDLRMPLICVGGTMDGGDRYPFEKEEDYQNFNIWMNTIVKVANYVPITLEQSRELSANSPDKPKRVFGFDFQKSYNIHMEGIDWHCGDFFDAVGVAVARFVSGEDLPHAQTKYQAVMIWDFIKHFSRDINTGESIYT